MRIIKKIVALIFGLLSLVAGLSLGYQAAVPTMIDWYTMSNWQSTQAKVLNVDSIENKTSAFVSYKFHNIEYAHKDVSATSFNHNTGDYYSKLFKQLSTAQTKGETITIWVNPANPEQAVFDRDIDFVLFFGLLMFCGICVIVGSAVCYFGVFKQPTTSKEYNRLKEMKVRWQQETLSNNKFETFSEFISRKYPELSTQLTKISATSPWLGRKAWQTNTIRSNAKAGMTAILLFTIVWFAMVIPLALLLPGELNKGNYASLLVLLFPLAGILLLIDAVVTTREYLRFGICEFTMNPFPGVLGGHVGGIIDLKKLSLDELPKTNPDFKILLECLYIYVTGTSKNRSRNESVKWSEEISAEVLRDGSGIQLRFRFAIPEELPESDVEQIGDYYLWRLTVRATLPGADLNRAYNIPVFATDAGTPRL